MKTYIVTGEDIGALEKLLDKHEVNTSRYTHIPALQIRTDMHYEELQQICTDYEVREEKTYDTQNANTRR